jgi:HD superfamily phosphohydrolase
MAAAMAIMACSSIYSHSLLVLQVVANSTNGIDVDKIDYLQRDALMAGIGQRYDFTGLLRNCKVSCTTAEMQLSLHMLPGVQIAASAALAVWLNWLELWLQVAEPEPAHVTWYTVYGVPSAALIG